MNIDKELEEIFDDPLLNISETEAKLLDIPEDMRKAKDPKKKADYVAQRKLCENFDKYQPLFKQVHKELKEGKRNLIKVSKTINLQAGHYYIVDGQMLLLESYEAKRQSSNFLPDGRTRCIYENGTESDILLQTLRKSVVSNGYAVTELREETERGFFSNNDLKEQDQVTGYIYILRSLSTNPAISGQKDLYKIGFSTNPVEERVANAEHEPTYLMAPIEIVASYKVVNMHSQKFENLIHQLLHHVQFHVTVIDDDGKKHDPKEWFVVPLKVVDTIIEKIMDDSIVNYSYNAEMQCLERHVVKQQSTFDTSGMKVLTLNIKKYYFDQIISGSKNIEYREMKQTMLNRYTYLDEADGKRYLRRYDALRLYVGYHKDRESALVQVVNTTYNEGIVQYHLGTVLEHINPNKD